MTLSPQGEMKADLNQYRLTKTGAATVRPGMEQENEGGKQAGDGQDWGVGAANAQA